MVNNYRHSSRESPEKSRSKQIVQLTNRQKELITLLAMGYQQDQIAKKLNISRDTVSYHFRNIKIVLDAKTPAQVVANAIMLGLIDIE